MEMHVLNQILGMEILHATFDDLDIVKLNSEKKSER